MPASGFVDIHSHVLYGLDDGAKTVEQSLAMLDIAARGGTTDIVATPHADGHYAYQPDLVAARIAELNAHSKVRVHRGCDFHLQVDNIQDAVAHPEKYSINGKGYLLVEFPSQTVFSSSDEILQTLLDAGMLPIVSHPERNPALQKKLDDLARWVDLGCLVQVTAASHTGLFGSEAKACARELLERGLTHFIASDAHNTKERSPNLQVCYEQLAERYGEERIRPLFVDNPRAVLTGDAVDVEPPMARPAKKWFQFWG